MKDDIEDLGYLLRDTSLALINKLNQEFVKANHDMTAEQFRALIALWEKDEQTQNELGDSIGKYKTSVTRLVDGLEKRGLIQRLPMQDDRRSNLIKLTAKGKSMKAKLLKVQHATLREAQRHIDAGRLEICRQVLKQIQQNITHGPA